MADEINLLKCPFCGSSNINLRRGKTIDVRDNGMYFVSCLNCGCRTPSRKKQEAIACWNQRRGVTDGGACKVCDHPWESHKESCSLRDLMRVTDKLMKSINKI